MTTYKIVHLLGLMMMFIGLGGLCTLASNGASNRELTGRKALTMAHGVGLLVMLVGGFGILARLGVTWPWPLWIWLKLGLWLLFGAIIVVIRKAEKAAIPVLLFVLPLLGALGAFLAFYKVGSS